MELSERYECTIYVARIENKKPYNLWALFLSNFPCDCSYRTKSSYIRYQTINCGFHNRAYYLYMPIVKLFLQTITNTSFLQRPYKGTREGFHTHWTRFFQQRSVLLFDAIVLFPVSTSPLQGVVKIQLPQKKISSWAEFSFVGWG